MRANPSIEHIFSELYHVREKRKPGYMKVKMLELLLFLSDLNTAEEVLQTDYFNQNQVALIKAVASYITEDLTAHHTIEQLSQKFIEKVLSRRLWNLCLFLSSYLSASSRQKIVAGNRVVSNGDCK